MLLLQFLLSRDDDFNCGYYVLEFNLWPAGNTNNSSIFDTAVVISAIKRKSIAKFRLYIV